MPEATQKPSVGRIVHFTPEVGATAGKSQPYPAVITHVHGDTCVNLAVFNDGSYPLQPFMQHPTSVALRTPQQVGGPCWEWPPRV
jgi:hypothetical protein